jgi:cysteine synthase A
MPNAIADSVLDLVGRTPLVRLSRVVPKGVATVVAKLEARNPGGSIQDRAALAMIEAAEREGRLREGAVLVEATSGNMGISLAMIAAVRGYRCVLVMPDDMSLERRYILRVYGADVVLTPAEQGMQGAMARAERIAQTTEGAVLPRQFDNAANADAHARTTARELIEAVGDELTAFVAAVGTGGTVTGVGRVLKHERPEVRIIAAEPAASAVLNGKRAGRHGIQGIGAGFVPPLLDREVIDEIVAVTDVAAARMAERLAREEGLLVGLSSGANVEAAVTVAQHVKRGIVATVLCDTGERYLF